MRHRLVVDGIRIVHLEREAKLAGLVVNDEYRVRGYVAPRFDGIEVHERDAFGHCAPQSNIVTMVWVGPAIRVTERSSLPIERIVVWASDGGRDRQRELANSGFPDPRRA
jgi:hypothetical protein